MKKNLVLGAAKGYNWDTLEPFVFSCKKNCPRAQLVLFVDEISDFTRNQLIREGCRLENFPAEMQDGFPHNTRWKLFVNFLELYGDDYEQILITDTRDVIFQGDVFEQFKDCKNYLGYTTEADNIIKNMTGEKMTYNQLAGLFGEAEAQKLSVKKIICCGTIIATVNEMKIFCHEMWKILEHETKIFDQGTMNYLVWNNLLSIENLIEIDVYSGEVFTMALYLNLYPINIRDGKILRGDGGVPAVVHQYDRRKELVQIIDKIYRAKDFQFDVRFVDTRSTIEQTISLLQVNKTGEATRLFLKKFLGKTDFSDYGGILIRLWDISSKKPLSQTLELLELAIQDSLKSVKIFSNINFYDVCKILKRAEQNGHPVDFDLKSYISNFLLIIAEHIFESNQPDRCFEFIKLFEGLGVTPDEKFFPFLEKANRIFGKEKF